MTNKRENYQTKYKIARPKKRVYAKEKFVENQSMLRELAVDQNARLTDVAKRNEILKQNKLYNLDLERRRLFSALQTLPRNQHENLQKYITGLEDQMFEFTRKGRVP